MKNAVDFSTSGATELMGHRRRTLPDAKARGLQGRILGMLAQHDDAQRLLETARAIVGRLTRRSGPRCSPGTC